MLATLTYSAYLDESFDMRGEGFFSVGGLIGDGNSLFELDRQWALLLKRPNIDIEYFKASECELGTGQFKKFVKVERHPTREEAKTLNAISMEFIDLILRYKIIGHGISVLQKDFYEVIKEPVAKDVFGGSPYRIGYDLAMIQCAWIMKHLERLLKEEEKIRPWNHVSKPDVCFFCDEHEEHSILGREAYLNLRKTNEEAAQYMATWDYGEDKVYPVLQAADAIVYEVRRANRLDVSRDGEIRPQFKRLADAKRMALIQIANKENLLNILTTQKPGEPLKLSEIMERVFEANIKFDFYEPPK
ncbi:MAG: DUF3800 domain-containing protein [Candidatus Acidiferrales bacterium]